jgi:hypothetical protein
VNFPVGTIIYFTPFYFPNGKSAPKNKYFIVLHQLDEQWVVASLPTSVDRVPERIAQEHGCLQLPEAMFYAYIFKPGRSVTNDGWSFPLTTYIYTAWVEAFDKRIFSEVYTVEDVDYQVIGRLTKAEYTALIQCALTSGDLKGRFRNALKKARY